MATVPPPDPSEGYGPLLDSFERQTALVKVVKNYGWCEFIEWLQAGRFRTATTLVPPGGRDMRLFGRVQAASCGVVWDAEALDLSDVLCWPSGYFAKTEFNVGADGKLKQGRDAALVTLEALREANRTLTYTHMGRTSVGQPLPYNEVLAGVGGAAGLRAVFVRSPSVAHLLYALGVRELLRRTLPEAGELPLLVLDSTHGARPFGRAAQKLVLQQYLRGEHRHDSVSEPRLPVDTTRSGLSAAEQVQFHGAYGVTGAALEALVAAVGKAAPGGDGDGDAGSDADGGVRTLAAAGSADAQARQVRSFVMLGMRAAVDTDNADSAAALVSFAGPLILAGACMAADEAAMAPFAALADGGRTAFERDVAALSFRAKSHDVLVAVGATAALASFAAGRTRARIVDACAQLETWLASSRSMVFRLQSWNGDRRGGEAFKDSEMTAFVTGKAVANRTRFHAALVELDKCKEASSYLAHLSTLVDKLHKPCLRLELLRQIVGLDERFNLRAVAGVVTLSLATVGEAAAPRVHDAPAEVLAKRRVLWDGDGGVLEAARRRSRV